MSQTSPSLPCVAIYVRQSVDEDQGIAQQLADCRAEIQRRGWLLVEEFQDNDTSATKSRGAKTDWAKMLRAFDDGVFDTLLVTETSRLTRSLTDVLEVSPPKRDVRVLTIREGIDTDVDDFLLKQLVLLAEREVKIKAQRAARYALERRAVGHPTSGMPPHGYSWVPAMLRNADGTRYAIHPAESEDVRYIYREFLAGAPMGQIARDLTDSGRRTRAGANWHSSTVRRILLNPLYAALLPPAQPSGEHDLTAIDLERCTPGAWEPIISRDELVASRGRLVGVKPNHDGTARRWLLSGLAVCSKCLLPVRSARGETHPTARLDGSGSAPAERYHAYRCVKGHFMRSGDMLDELVAEVCIARLSQPDLASLLTPKDDQLDIRLLHAHREELQAKRGTIAQLVTRGLPESEALEALDSLIDQLRVVDAQISRAVEREPLADLVGIADIRAWWDSASLARRRGVVDRLMSVEIQPIGKGRRVLTLEAAAETVTLTPRG